MKLTKIKKIFSNAAFKLVDFLCCSLKKTDKKPGFLVLALALSVGFGFFIANHKIDVKAQSLPSCAALASNETPQVGVNCLYYGLPLCKDVAKPNHRMNCADIIDLPLCSDIVVRGGLNPSSPQPGKNCVELCSGEAYGDPDPEASPKNVRGVDYAIFNKDCMRFCDKVEADFLLTPDEGKNCAPRKCHQLEDGVVPNAGVNCDILQCNRLTPDELNKPKFDDSSKKYCNGDNIKCYEFLQSQLPYIRLRKDNPMCQIHNCKPSSPTCGDDETLEVAKQGSPYVAAYETFINAGYPLDSNVTCNPLYCKVIVHNQFRCTDAGGKITGDNLIDVHKNSGCDATGEGSSCVLNYCFETVDCNLAINKSRHECGANPTQSTTNAPFVDQYDSWFYRPKPLDKAVDPKSGVPREMGDGDNGLCYTRSQMDHVHDWGRHIKMGIIDFGWFHYYLLDSPRSPGACSAPRFGDRGSGYIYLCGTGTSLYNKPSDYAAYYSGHTRTTFNNNSAKHLIRICLRFKNTINFDACGKRECGIASSFSDVTQQCGGDSCHDFEIDEADQTKCMMNEDFAQSSKTSGCSKTTDLGLRTRAVQYGDRICGFLDSRGQNAFAGMFDDGSEVLEDGVTCVNDPDGSGNSAKGCDGYNSNKNPVLAHLWRQVMKIPYVQNNRPSSDSVRGYLDKSGKLFPEQECPKVTLRIPPPDHYNLANIKNSERLFVPPLFIKSVVKIRDGEDASPEGNQDYGTTDFHYPEIRVQYGSVSSKMSLGLDEISGVDGAAGLVKNHPNSPAYQTLSIEIRAKTYQAEVFVKKEYEANSGKPVFCLYRKIKDQNGLYVEPYRIACVNRNLPEIDNRAERLSNPKAPVRKAVTSLDQANKSYDNSKIILQYLTSFGPNGNDNRCLTDDLCTKKLSLGNPDYKQPICSKDSEGYQVCVQREECSQIYIECVKNEIEYNNAINSGLPSKNFESVRKNCNDNLIPFCNAKKSLANASAANLYDITPKDSIADPKVYGWFNEICVVSGFEQKLKNVIAHSIANNLLGKCIVDPTSPYLMDNNPETKCDGGGFAPNCLCAIAPDGYITGAGEVVRKQTAREAGLCTDMTIPKLCQAVDYNPNPNPVNFSDPEYISQSLAKILYNDNGGVHTSHQLRTLGITGHAEFSPTFFGVNDTRGQCKGFWTYQKNSFGVILYPKMSCLNVEGEAKWDYENMQNHCVRYSCKAINTLGPDANGKYQGDYDANETDEAKGLSHGFATWRQYTKTNDFLETATAASCIAGFKADQSSALYDASGKTIVGYSGGILPTRSCDQLGSWMPPVSYCKRIQCQAINPALPTSALDAAAWEKWFESGGATFPAVYASRSAARIQQGSTSYGACNNSLGFFQSPNGKKPSRECDYLGNWGPVENSCVSTCNAILIDAESASLNNGFSKWSEANGTMTSTGIEGQFVGCSNGYITYPYPPTKDINGNPLANAADLNREAENPRRLCRVGKTSLGAEVSVWASVINACVNKCPGAEYDDRIGVGRTAHKTSSGEITINWSSGDFNQYQYISNWNDEVEHFDARHFNKGRTNKYYLMRRFCNPNGKWSEPEPLCSANNGLMGTANYYDASKSPGYTNSIVAGAPEYVEGKCLSSPKLYWPEGNGKGKLPQRQCVFENDQKLIDKVYLELANNTKDCEEIKCAPSSYLGELAIINAPQHTLANQQVAGRCLNNEKNKANATVFTSLAGVAPKLECQKDGTWKVVDELNCKKACNMPAHYEVHLDISGSDGNGDWFHFDAHTMQNGESFTFTAYECKSKKCVSWAFGETCRDGTAYTVDNPKAVLTDSDWWRDYAYASSGQVRRGIYDPVSNTITGYVLNGKTSGWGVDFGGGDIKTCNDCWLYSTRTYKDRTGASQKFKVYDND